MIDPDGRQLSDVIRPEPEARKTFQRFAVEHSSQVSCCTIPPTYNKVTHEHQPFTKDSSANILRHKVVWLINVIIILYNSQDIKHVLREKVHFVPTKQSALRYFLY